jgi:hypothetical protein
MLALSGHGFEDATTTGSASRLLAVADGLWSTSNHGTYWQFDGTSNASLTRTAWMTLRNSNLGIGTTTPTYKLTVDHTTSLGIAVTRGGKYIGINANAAGSNTYSYIEADTGMAMAFNTNGANERMRITSAGYVGINTTTSGGWATNAQLEAVLSGNGSALSGYCTTSSGGGGQALQLRINATTYSLAQFFYSTTSVGTITTNGTVTVYGGTSDYRRKSNVKDLTDSGTFIDALKPRTFDWDSGEKGVGFIAHEFAEVCPSAVSGEKDAVDSDGKPKYQSMQAGSAEVIANLVAELQSVRQRLAALEA